MLLSTKEAGCYLPFALPSHWNYVPLQKLWSRCKYRTSLTWGGLQQQWWKRGPGMAVPMQARCCDTEQKICLLGKAYLLSVVFMWLWVLEVSVEVTPWAHAFFRENESGEIEKNLDNLSSLSLPWLMDLSLQEISSSFYLPFRVFIKTAEDQTQENTC